MCIQCSSKHHRKSVARIPQSEFYFGRGGPSPPHMRSLGLDFPALVKEWNYAKNGNYTPYNITPHSHERAHWLCKKCKLPYDTFIFSRTSKKPSGCPYCAGQKPIPHVNDLFSRYPHLVKEWDWEQNKKGPDEYCSYSGQKVYWICSYCNHSYFARIVNRTANGTGCPCCSGQKVVKHISDLQTTHPHIAIEWDHSSNGEATPDQFSYGSNRIFNWICPLGHSYPAMIKNRTIKGEGCPVCANRKVVKGENDLAFTHPHIAEEWDYEKNGTKRPDQYTYGSDEYAWWICPTGKHSYWQRIADRTCHDHGCPCIHGNKVYEELNSLQAVYPDFLREWDWKKNDKFPSQYTAYSNEEVHWICQKCKGSYPARIDNRTLKDNGCPYCTNTELLSGFNDLQTRVDGINALWDYTRNKFLPSQVIATVNATAYLFCSEGHSYEATINGSTGEISTCPYCNNRELLPGYNDLQTRVDGINALWDYTRNKFLPSQVIATVNATAYFFCSEGHSYEATINGSTGEISTCPYCNNRELLPGYNDLQTRVGGIDALWDYVRNKLLPNQVIATVNATAYLFCSEGHSYEATINGRTSEISSCPYCNKKLPIVGETDLLSVHPELRERYDQAKNKKPPELHFPYSPSVVSWVCENNHSFRAPIREMAMRWRCKECDRERRKSRRCLR